MTAPPTPSQRKLASRSLFDTARLKYRICKMGEKRFAAPFLSDRVQRLWSAYLAAVVRTPPPPLTTAILAHVYYPDMLPEILALAENFPRPPHLHVTTRPEVAGEVRSRLPSGVEATVHVTANRGRDVAPALRLLADGSLDRYDAVLKVHTKRSPHVRNGEMRRRLSFTMLGGQPKQVDRILQLFARPDTGMVGWNFLYRDNPFYWHDNAERVAVLCRRMGIKPCLAPQFFEGTMFWFRPAALAPLRKLDLRTEDFEPEPSPVDGCLHHAVERVFCNATLAAGYKVLSNRGRVLAA